MTSINIISGSMRDLVEFPAEGRPDGIRDMAAGLFYFTMVAIVFAFVLVLTTGAHP